MRILCTTLLLAAASSALAAEQPAISLYVPMPETLSAPAAMPSTPASIAIGPTALLVTMKTDASSTDDQICVGNVAKLTGVPEPLAAEIAKFPVGRAANPGQIHTVSPQDVLSAIQRYSKTKLKVELKGNDVKVMAEAEIVTGAQLADAAMNAVRTELSKDPDLEVRTEAAGATPDQTIRAGQYQLEAELPEEGVRPGSQSVRVRVIQSGKRVAETVCTITAHVTCSINVAAEHIASNDLLEATEIKVIRKEVTVSELKERCDTAKLCGMRARSTISAGQMLVRSQFALPFVIKRGDAVQLIVHRGSLELTASGQARNDAALDDAVRVFVSDSNAEVIARASGVREACMDDPNARGRH